MIKKIAIYATLGVAGYFLWTRVLRGYVNQRILGAQVQRVPDQVGVLSKDHTAGEFAVTLMGRSVAEASAMAQANGYRVFIVRPGQPVPADLIGNRIRIQAPNGAVVSALAG